MRIGIVHNYTLTGSGSSTYVLGLIRALIRKGHYVVLISREPHYDRFGIFSQSFIQTTDDSWRNSGACQVSDITGRAIGYSLTFVPYLGVETHPECKEFFDTTNELALQSYLQQFSKAVQTVVEDERLEILHVNHVAPLPYIASLVKKACQIPYIVTLHGSHIEYVLKRDRRYIPYARTGLENAARVIITAHDVQVRCQSFIPIPDSQFALIPVGVDTEAFQPLLDDGNDELSIEPHLNRPLRQRLSDWKMSHSKIIFIGKMVFDKGVHILPYVLPKLLEYHNDAKLAIIGAGQLLGPLQMLASGAIGSEEFLTTSNLDRSQIDLFLSQVNLHDYQARVERAMRENCVVLGPLAQDDVRKVLAASEVCVIPSIIDEALPMIVLEALSSGALPIMRETSGFKEIVAELRTHVQETTQIYASSVRCDNIVEEFALKTCAGLNLMTSAAGTAVQKKLRSLAVDGYAWDAIAAQIETLYQGALR